MATTVKSLVGKQCRIGNTVFNETKTKTASTEEHTRKYLYALLTEPLGKLAFRHRREMLDVSNKFCHRCTDRGQSLCTWVQNARLYSTARHQISCKPLSRQPRLHWRTRRLRTRSRPAWDRHACPTYCINFCYCTVNRKLGTEGRTKPYGALEHSLNFRTNKVKFRKIAAWDKNVYQKFSTQPDWKTHVDENISFLRYHCVLRNHDLQLPGYFANSIVPVSVIRCSNGLKTSYEKQSRTRNL